MLASHRVLAERYGRAFFQAAEAAREEDRAAKDLAEAHRAVRDAQAYFKNPKITIQDKRKKLQEALGSKISATALKFVNLLLDKKRIELLALVAHNVGRFAAEKKNLAKAVVKSAKPLSAEAQGRIKKLLESLSGKTVELDVREDSELIGGLVVRLGDWVIDGSLKGQIKRLKEEMHVH